MQTTLLGFAIGIILALVTALVGPHFVDWNKYRGEFEAKASQLTGMPVRITGAIDARVLPTPTLIMQSVEVGKPGQSGTVRARSLGVEFSLSSLMRGEWRASNARIEGAEFALGLDASGHIEWPAASIGFDPDAVSIQQLDISDSRAVLADAANGTTVVLENFEFNGELRSLAGPLKGEGAFVVSGQHYPYRVSAGRADDGSSVKVKLNIDPIDRPLTVQAEASVSIENGTPHFDGTLQLVRPVGRAPEGAQALIIEPWRLVSHIKGDSSSAVLEQIEFQYGPDDRAIKLHGDAKLAFGRFPRLDGVLSSTQIDLDRVLALPEATRRRPAIAIKSLADNFAAWRVPVPANFGVSVENVTFAGAILQRVTGDLHADSDGWDIESLDLRAPGATQVRLSGRFATTPKGVSFAGPAKIDTPDPRAFVAWLTDRSDTQGISASALRIEGEVKIGSDTVAVDRLKAEVDHMTLEGRFAYFWANAGRPARLDAALSAPDLDFDRSYALAQGIFGSTAFDWPREGTLSLKLGRASLAGVEAKGADINMRLNADGLEIERLAIGEFGGAALAVTGRIDTRARLPRGALAFDLDARNIDGVTALLEKISPQSAEQLRHVATRFVPAKLHATLALDSTGGGTAGTLTTGKFAIDGSAGVFHVNLQGDAGAPIALSAGGVSFDDLSGLSASKLGLKGQVDATDGGALVALVGLDRLLSVDKRPGHLAFTANGPGNGDLAVDGQLLAGGLDVSAKGTMRLSGGQGPSAALALNVAAANVQRPVPAGRLAESLPATMKAKLSYGDGAIGLSDLTGKIAGTDVSGRFDIALGQPTAINGDLSIATVDLPAVLASFIGMPPAGGAAWPTEPFEAGLFDAITGQIKVKSARAAVSPTLTAHDFRAVLNLDPSELALTEIDGALAGGRIAGDLAFQRTDDGIAISSRIRVAAADITEFLPGEGRPAISGRLTLDLKLDGMGRSPGALIGALAGGGSFTLQDGTLARLDPRAFDAIIRAADQGLPIDALRVRDRMESVLTVGGLRIPLAEGEIMIADSQARLTNTVVRAQGADLAANGSIDFVQNTIDARLTESATGLANPPDGARPEIVISLKGPIAAPVRLVDASALASWLALRAIDQQSKRLDALESGQDTPATPVDPPAVAPVPDSAAVTPLTQKPASAQPTAPVRRARPRPAPQRAAPAAPSWLPPLDILRPFRSNTRSDGTAKSTPRQAVPATPGRSASESSVGP